MIVLKYRGMKNLDTALTRAFSLTWKRPEIQAALCNVAAFPLNPIPLAEVWEEIERLDRASVEWFDDGELVLALD